MQVIMGGSYTIVLNTTDALCKDVSATRVCHGRVRDRFQEGSIGLSEEALQGQESPGGRQP
jgi:hypothetical protein